MMSTNDLPFKVRFTPEHNRQFRGAINRHNRRKYLKLSRLGRLMSTDVPVGFAMATDQYPPAKVDPIP